MPVLSGIRDGVFAMSQQLSVKRNMLWNSVGSLISLVCQWLTTVMVVRLSTGFDAAGTLSLAMAIANVFQPIALFSMRSYQVSDVKRDTSAREYVAFRLVTIVVAFLACASYSFFTSGAAVMLPVCMYLAYKAGEVFTDVLHGVDQQHMRMDYCGKSMATRGTLSLIGFCAGLVAFDSLEIAIAAMLLLSTPVMVYDWHRASQFEDIRPSITLHKIGELTGSCFPAVIGTACCSAVVSVARQRLGVLEGQDALGLYASVCTPVVVIQSCIRYIYAPLLGEFASKIDRNDIEGYISLFVKVIAAFVAFSVLGVVGFKLFGRQFLQIVFDAKVASLSSLLDMAIVSVVLCALVSFLSDQLIAFRRLWGVLFGNFAGLCVSLIFSSYFINTYGLNGTSIIIVLAFCVSALCLLCYLLKSLFATRKC